MTEKVSTFCETCEGCGQRKSDVELQIDPYEYEINGNDALFMLCDDCVNISREEI